MQESKEPTTAVTTLGRTMQESNEPTTAVTTEPQGTTLGRTMQESKEPTTAVTTLGRTMQESNEPTTAVTTEPQDTTLGRTMQESKEPTTAITTLGRTMQESNEPTTAVTTEPQGTTLGSTIYTCPPNMIYGNCTCEATCEDPKEESACNSTCLGSTGCICKAGLMLNGSDCISASRCSCFVAEANLVISNGKTYVNDNCTQKCSCSNNRLICEDDYSCSANAVCDVKNEVRQCYCNEGYEVDGGSFVSLPFRDCQDVYDAGHRQDAVHTIKPTGWPGLPFNVSCKMENGGGWTVFQRRTDGSTSFYQHWAAYKDRFGDSRNLWLGNEKLHYLTNQRNYKLRFDITSSSGLARYAEYTDFQIESETSNYTMSELGNEGGNTGYDLTDTRGKQFSTHDRDNDAFGNFNCAEKHRSGWWHSNDDCSTCASNSLCDYFQYSSSCKSACTSENLNGVYNGGNGEMIYSDFDTNCNVQYVEMKIRPSS
ncbi:techylectin-5A-like [Apostichopus japonicus]|uniref:techylectin-5A-like n=1 Tax=Stichopus japonicus TaxID=307972 RepID=UPI003AB73CCB